MGDQGRPQGRGTPEQYPPPQGQWGPPPQAWGPAQWPPPPPGPPPGWSGPPAYPLAQRPPVARPLPPFPHPEPREYHQMLRTWNYRWWKPVVGVVALIAGVLAAHVAMLPVLALAVWALESGDFVDNLGKAASFEVVGPAALLYLNLALGSSILVAWLVMRVLHRMRPRWLTSVVPKMRWKLLVVCLGLSVLALIAQVVVSVVISLLVPAEGETGLPTELNPITGTTVLIAIIVLLTTPLQAAGEEYVFRGYLLQAVGSLSGSKWLALLVTALLFAMAHGVQNFPLFFDRFMFGLIAGWLVIRTGGLEAAIALHVLNNFLAFGVALAVSDLTETLTTAEVSWWNVPVTLTQSATYALLVVLVARRMNLQRRTSPPADALPATDARGPEPVPARA